MDRKSSCDGRGNFVLDLEDLFEGSIKPLGPNRLSPIDPNQLHADSQVRIAPPQTSCQEEIQIPLVCDVVNRAIRLSKRKCAFCRQDPKG